VADSCAWTAQATVSQATPLAKIIGHCLIDYLLLALKPVVFQGISIHFPQQAPACLAGYPSLQKAARKFVIIFIAFKLDCDKTFPASVRPC
jgi:hypothetical protein